MKKIVLILSLFGALNAQASIQEVTEMSQILPSINQETLLVLDLDNTVLEPVQTLGSDQWFKKSLLAGGLSVEDAIGVWEPVQRVTRVQPVETVTPEIVAKIQAKGISVMALTARPFDLSGTTEVQLASIGVDFQNRSPYPRSFINTEPNSFQYLRGIEYIGPKLSKGDALVHFLKNTGLRPKRIVFVDDTPIHTQTVNAALDSAGIENFEFRYGADDKKVQAYAPALAAFELKVFQQCYGQLISDHTAELSSQDQIACY